MQLTRLAVAFVFVLLATPVVIFWLWLVIVPLGVAKDCPQGCRCDPGSVQVSCTDSNLNDISFTFLKSIIGLYVVNNNLIILQKDFFISRGLSELMGLSLVKGNLTTIEFGAFKGLTKLTHLSLLRNNIDEVPPGAFEELSSLKYLDLSFNVIEKLDAEMFRGLQNVECLLLMRNKLQQFHPDLFSGLPNLQKLYLNFNLEVHIPEYGYFIRSSSLKRLFMRQCGIRSLSIETFANVSTLDILDLSFNGLRYLQIDMFKNIRNLSELYLHGNPLHCDCKLKEVWQWCMDSKVKVNYDELRAYCKTPKEFIGKYWGVLNETDCLKHHVNTTEGYITEDTVGSKWDRQYSGSAPRASELRYLAMFAEGVRNCSDVVNYQQNKGIYQNRTNLLKEILGPVLAVPFTFGTIGNMIIIIIIISNKDMRTVPNMYILNLAISDIIYLMVHFAEAWVYKTSDTWADDGFVCKFLPFCRRLSVGLSAYSIAVLSIIRYRVTVNPLHVRASSQSTLWVTVATVCGVWIVAALFALPSAFSENLCHAYVISDKTTYYQLVVLFETFVSCGLPLCVIGFSYIVTARHLMKSADPISEGGQNPQINKRKSTVKIVLGLTAVFLISSVPYHVFWAYIISIYTPYRAVASYIPSKDYYFQYISIISSSLFFLNPCLNPVALFCTSLAFRGLLKRYLKCCREANPT